MIEHDFHIFGVAILNMFMQTTE